MSKALNNIIFLANRLVGNNQPAIPEQLGDLMPSNSPVNLIRFSSEDIVLITLTAILILLGGAAIIRLVHLLCSKSRPNPKVFIECSSSVPSTLATPQIPSKLMVLNLDDSYFSSDQIEKDITFSFPFVHPQSPPSSPKRVPAFLREEEEDISAMLSIRAGKESVCRRSHREKKQSESGSLTTASTVLDSLCQSVQRSSVTSVYSTSIESEEEDEEEEMEEVEIYEVKRAQTQSMEVKRGVLMSWRASRPPSPIPEMPTVVISESSSDTALEKTSILPRDGSLLQALPSLLVTHPSDISLVSSASSVSVDLDEFPLPPTLPPISKTDCGNFPLLLIVPDYADGPLFQMSREEKRTTVEQVITLYE